jgi:hypothetical protein
MRLCKFVLALTVVALLCAPALAQRQPGGRGGRGGFGGRGSIDSLAQNKSVQDELKVDADQKKKIDDSVAKVKEDLKTDYDKLRQRDASEEDRTAARKKTSEAQTKALKDVFKDDQMKRLQQIVRQQEGLRVFQDEDVQSALKLTDDQKSKIKEINEALSKERRELFQGGGGGGGGRGQRNPEAITKLRGLEKDAMTNAQKTLTDDQKKTLKDLTGEPFEVKYENRAGGQGRGGQGGGGRPGGGGKPRSDF